MGSQAMQAKLWGQQPKDWATIQEPTAKSAYEYVLDFIKLRPTDKLLDVGCGTGFFISLAAKSGADITGFDATVPFIGAPGPFALTENHLLETILEETGLKVLDSADVDSIWDYPDMETAMKGLLSAGPAARAIEIQDMKRHIRLR